jgi:hypothetical protein
MDMIDAELHGKLRSELHDDEDLLTSAVFGTLQYVPPNVFWPMVLARAQTRNGMHIISRLTELGIEFAAYERMTAHFWPVHHKLGEPDLLLVYSGGNQPSICFIIESKLWATKSGSNEQDQLNRYLLALEDSIWLAQVTGFHKKLTSIGLVYLTPRAAWSELSDSIRHGSAPSSAEDVLFLLEWQDISETARQASHVSLEPYRTMLGKVADFLECRGLSYFRGFDHHMEEDMPSDEPAFYTPNSASHFCGFTLAALEELADHEIVDYQRLT